LCARRVKRHPPPSQTSGQSDDKQRTLQDTAGIPTGVAFDIQRQIEVRRAKQTADEEKSKAEAFVRQVVQVKMAAAAMPKTSRQQSPSRMSFGLNATPPSAAIIFIKSSRVITGVMMGAELPSGS